MPEDYEVRGGDCLNSLAEERGLTWQKIWNHSKNARLKQLRKDPNILMPGDLLFIPDLERKDYSKVTERRHRFRKKGDPARLRLRILEEERSQDKINTESPASAAANDELNVTYTEPGPSDKPRKDKPRANVPYVLVVDGTVKTGSTDSDGRIETTIPQNARSATLTLEPGTPREKEIPLNLGYLNPINEISGVKHRLNNLGFMSSDTSNEMTDELAEALREFQKSYGLDVTGEIDENTRNKIRDLHGG
jgi:hypothetical protein